MRNERWLISLGHVRAQVSCAIAKSYFAAVIREESEKRGESGYKLTV